jgi:hypothetical protein
LDIIQGREKKLAAVIGFNSDGNKTGTTICTIEQCKEAAENILHMYPNTEDFGIYAIRIEPTASDAFGKEELDRIPQVVPQLFESHARYDLGISYMMDVPTREDDEDEEPIRRET